MINNSMGIYIHIPFCMKKCNYCDFLSFPVNEEIKPLYVNALKREIDVHAKLYGKESSNDRKIISSIFFGGGTPSILESKFIYDIMQSININFDIEENAEITIECNPGTLNLLKLSDYKYCGINRISIGLQSTNDEELLSLGRIHNYISFVESYNDARKAGFNNINIDIMSALPGQTIPSYTDTLNKVINFEPEHISAYSLIIEEGTPFHDIYANNNKNVKYSPLPDEDSERDMYYLTEELLNKSGYNRYEISNYSKKGYECLHNLSYWDRVNYLGIGLGSSSLINNVRYKNISSLSQYIDLHNKKLIEEKEILTKEDCMSEFMFLGLRKMKGISKIDFKDLFNIDINTIYGKQIEKLVNDNLIHNTSDIICLTKRGIDVSNFVFSEFIN